MSAEQSFRVSGAGRYRQRNGEIVRVRDRDGLPADHPYPWADADFDNGFKTWADDGSAFLGYGPHELDLVERVFVHPMPEE